LLEKSCETLNIIEVWEDSFLINGEAYYRFLFRTDENNKVYNSTTFLKTWGFYCLPSGVDGVGIYWDNLGIYPTRSYVYHIGKQFPIQDSFAIQMVNLPKGMFTPLEEQSKIGNLYFKALK